MKLLSPYNVEIRYGNGRWWRKFGNYKVKVYLYIVHSKEYDTFEKLCQ